MSRKIAIGRGWKIKDGKLIVTDKHKSVPQRIAERKSKKVKPARGPKCDETTGQAALKTKSSSKTSRSKSMKGRSPPGLSTDTEIQYTGSQKPEPLDLSSSTLSRGIASKPKHGG